MPFYCVRTKHKMEATAERELEKQGYNVFLPMCVNEKKNKKNEPLFPTYLFIELTMGVDDFAPIRSTYGVQGGLVRFGNHIPEVPEYLIEDLKKISQNNVIRLEQDFYKVGDKVRITSGTLKLLEGVITARTKDDRVWVLIKELGSHPIKLNIKQIENT